MRRMAAGALGGLMTLAIMISGCAEENEVVLDKMVALEDGHFTAWKLEPGLYRVEMTASSDGASVRWEGAPCPESGQTKNLSTICELRQTGQLVVSNPSALGLGAGTTVTVKVTRMATAD